MPKYLPAFAPNVIYSLNNVELPEKDYDISICDDDY